MDFVLRLIQMADAASESEQREIFENFGSAFGALVVSSTTEIDDTLVAEVALPNARIFLDAAQARIEAGPAE